MFDFFRAKTKRTPDLPAAPSPYTARHPSHPHSKKGVIICNIIIKIKCIKK